jgi:Putative Ig domain
MRRASLRSGILIACMGVVLAACGPEDTAAPATPPAGSAAQTPVNITPTISGNPTATVVAGTTYLFQPSTTDGDGDTLTFSATGLPAWANINAQTGAISGTPSQANVGTTADIVLSVWDGEAGASLPAFRITISSSLPPPVSPPASNAAPVISGSPSTSIQATNGYTFTPAASDPESRPLTFSISNRPAWAAFSTSTGTLSGTPTTAQVQTYGNIVISVSDGALSAALPAFSITVTAAPNRAPTISGSAATTVTAGSAYSFAPAASDPDGQTLAYSISNKPGWAAFSAATGRLSGTPTSANVGTYSNIIISVSDGALSASLVPFTLTVSPAPNVAPTISGAPATTVVAGNAYRFTPTASDADGNTLAFTISSRPAWATFSTATGALTGTPTTAQVGSYTNIVISVSDGTVSRALPAFAITVTAATATGTAALSWAAPTQNTDGSALTDLAGYRIYHGTSATALNDVVQLSGAGITSYSYTQLASGTHYFAVSAYSGSGVESALSATGSKAIP